MITAHMIVKNEEKWIWFSILSVIDHVDKVIIFDTGSTDRTRDILKIIQISHPDKVNVILFENFPEKEIAFLRQKQIEMTTTEWFMILDGDEIWPRENIKKIISLLKSTSMSLIAVPFTNFVGNLDYIQNPAANSYRIKDKTGSITLRFIRSKYMGVNAAGIYGVEGYYDKNGKPIQENCEDLLVVDHGFQHTSLLIRSSGILKDFSIKYRRKKLFAKSWKKRNFELAEVLTQNNLPPIVPNPNNYPNILMKIWYKYYAGVKW